MDDAKPYSLADVGQSFCPRYNLFPGKVVVPISPSSFTLYDYDLCSEEQKETDLDFHMTMC